MSQGYASRWWETKKNEVILKDLDSQADGYKNVINTFPKETRV